MLDLLDPAILSTILSATDAPRPVPEDSEVRAGYVALFLWLGMCVAVALLGWSLVRQFRKTSAADEAGLYDEPERPKEPRVELRTREDDQQS